jgi:eukaryotic-like serine/threonine-protein kinase
MKAISFADQLNREHPSDTFIQKYWLPITRAETDLHLGEASRAVEALNLAEPLDWAAPEALDISTLYPVYARGQAYLAVGDGSKAADQFQELIDHPGMVLNYPLGALARLGIARAHRLSQQNNIAIEDYDAFFALWKDADPDIPLLKQAKAEYSKLQ